MTEKEYVFVVLAEECSEVIKDISKGLRFGFDDKYPNRELNNAQNVTLELADLLGVMEMLIERGLIERPLQSDIDKKKIKVEKYMKYSKERGTLE